MTLKNGTKKIFDDTLTISGGELVISLTDTSGERKISLAQGTTIKLANDNETITATAKADTAAYFWRDAKGMFYFKIDGDAANFDLIISQPDGTETFNGEITFGGCITYNDKKPNLSLISDPSNNNGYETFVQLKDDTKTIYAQTAGKTVMLNPEIDDGKITVDFTKKGNNLVLLNVTQDGTETFNDIAEIEGSLTLDTLQRKLLVNKGTKITAARITINFWATRGTIL